MVLRVGVIVLRQTNIVWEHVESSLTRFTPNAKGR